MFRASEIFGRRPGARLTAQTQAQEPPKKKPRDASAAAPPPQVRTWDPATGEYVEEDVPAELQELMGLQPNRAKEDEGASVVASAVGSAAPVAVIAPRSRAPTAGEIDRRHPSVEYRGFSKADLNDRYYEKRDLPITGRPTFWTADARFFLYWQGGEVKRWSICDASGLPAVRAGQFPGWVYKDDHGHLCEASGWMEACGNDWKEPNLEVIYRSSSSSPPQWEDAQLQRNIVVVEFAGFAMTDLNARYTLRASEVVQGEPTYWNSSGVYFVYWQQAMRRWAICDGKCLEGVKSGQCLGWAYRADDKHFANACGWMERRADMWALAVLETAVIAVCTKGLKVQFSGFTKSELNTQYAERASEEVQGRVTYWDPSDTYFVYWQSSMLRWALCDRPSLQAAKSGLAPGWAYRTDSRHFARSRGWMEAWGNEWKRATVTCTVLEGTVKDDLCSSAKAKQDAAACDPVVYRSLIRSVYEARNPTKLEDLEGLFEKYQGKEKEFYQNVCQKYGVDAEKMLQEAAVGSTSIA